MHNDLADASGGKWHRMAIAGSYLAIAAYVLTQFVEVTFFSVGAFPITFQKAVAAAVFPLALLMMGRVRVSLALIGIAIGLLATNSASYVARGQPLDGRALSANTTVIIGLLSAVVLYTALTRDRQSFPFLRRAWIVLSLISGTIAILQAVGMLPLWTVASEALSQRGAAGGYYRGVGLKVDPNFQALVLVVGVVFARGQRGPFRVPIVVYLFLALLATFSRMGLLAALLVLILMPMLDALANRGQFAAAFGRGVFAGSAIFGLGVLLYVAGPDQISTYLGRRTVEVIQAVGWIVGEPSSGAAYLTSAQARLLLVWTAWGIGVSNFPLGIGAHRSEELIYDATGLRNVAHDTYVELLATGGIFGLATLALYIHALLRSLREPPTVLALQRERLIVVAQTLAFGFIGLFLSLNYNSILWLPVTLALAYRARCTRQLGF